MTFFKDFNYDQNIEDWKERIERCIDRLNFLALYTIYPDLVTSGICLILRERRLVKPEEDSTLEDNVGKAVQAIIPELWIGKGELDSYIRILRLAMLELVKNNEAQKEFENIVRLKDWRR